jgi:hypothetical protein
MGKRHSEKEKLNNLYSPTLIVEKQKQETGREVKKTQRK